MPISSHDCLNDLDVVWMRYLEDAAIVKCVIALCIRRQLNGGVPIGMIGIENVMQHFEPVCVWCLNQEEIIPVNHTILIRAQGIGNLDRRLYPIILIQFMDVLVNRLWLCEGTRRIVLNYFSQSGHTLAI